MAKDTITSQFHKRFSKRIRFVRALGRCECEGMCGKDHLTESGGRTSRCLMRGGHKNPQTGNKVEIALVFLDRDRHNPKYNNVKAMCFSCWGRYRQRPLVAEKKARRWAKFINSDLSRPAPKPGRLSRRK